jgi:hypothetical protein
VRAPPAASDGGWSEPWATGGVRDGGVTAEDLGATAVGTGGEARR